MSARERRWLFIPGLPSCPNYATIQVYLAGFGSHADQTVTASRNANSYPCCSWDAFFLGYGVPAAGKSDTDVQRELGVLRDERF